MIFYLEKPVGGPLTNEYDFPRLSNMYGLFIETYQCGVDSVEDIKKLYWRVLNGDSAENSKMYYFSNIFSPSRGTW
jgi:hypothetical protein